MPFYKGGSIEGTNLWVFENLVFLRSLLEEHLVLAVPDPRRERLHEVLVLFKRPFCQETNAAFMGCCRISFQMSLPQSKGNILGKLRVI